VSRSSNAGVALTSDAFPITIGTRLRSDGAFRCGESVRACFGAACFGAACFGSGASDVDRSGTCDGGVKTAKRSRPMTAAIARVILRALFIPILWAACRVVCIPRGLDVANYRC
jgi:hypothetical protein